MKRFAKLIVVLAAGLIIADIGWGMPQRSERRSSGRQSAAQQRSDNSAKAETQEPKTTAEAKFKIHLADGKVLEATEVAKQRNGDLQVKLTDGTTTKIARADLKSVEDLSQQPASESKPSAESTRSGRQPSNSQSRSRSAGDRAEASNSPNMKAPARSAPSRSAPSRSAGELAGSQPSKTADKREADAALSAQSFLIKLDQGQTLTAVSAVQQRRGQWQVSTEDGKRLMVETSKITELANAQGQPLKATVGRNGEIIFVLDDGDTSNPGNSNNPAPSSAAPGNSIVMYNTLGKPANSAGSVARVRQAFIASGDYLETIEFRSGGSGEIVVRVRDQQNNLIGEQTGTVNGNSLTSVDFAPALNLDLGGVYWAEIARPEGNSSGFQPFVTNNEEYVFSRFESDNNAQGSFSALSGDQRQNDLAMKITGKTPVSSTNPPNQRALLVLLENDGIVSSLNAAAIDYPDLPEVPYMTYTGSECDIEFKLNKNESIAQALQRVAGELQELAEATLGTPPPATNPVAAAQYANNLANLAGKLANPNNWEIRTVTADTFIEVVSDFVIEKFTASYISGQASGKYNTIVVMEDTQFEADQVINKIAQLAPNYVLDIHVLSHGAVDTIVGHETNGPAEVLNRETFFIPLQQAVARGDIPLHLRAVYQCICEGGTTRREWLGVGAQVVCGTAGEKPSDAKSNYMPQQYIHFLNYWCGQTKSFSESCDRSFNDSRAYSESVYSALSDKPDLINDSRMIISGNGSVKRTD